MKKTSLLLAIFTMLLFSACENQFEPNSNSDIGEILSRNSDEIELEKDILEAQMQWVAFTISGMLLEDNDNTFRHHFQAISESAEPTVLLDDLFGDEVFSNRFSALSSYYFLGYSDINVSSATRPTNKPPNPPSGIPSEEVQYSFFIDAVKSYKCVEIYLPNVLDFDVDPIQILSTAHPLTNADENDAYMNEIKRGGREDVLAVKMTKVKNDFVGDDINIIAVRPISPKPSLPQASCDYSHFNVNDFTEFLNGE